MKVVVVLACLCLGVISARPLWNELSADYTFEMYKRDFNKHYSEGSENEKREALFAESLRVVLRHNANLDSSYRMGINHMSDWTPEEFKATLGYHKGIGHRLIEERSRKFARGEISIPDFGRMKAPFQVDWRDKGILSAVKDQGQCGSCWSFAVAETIESHWALATGELNELSQQHVLDCTPDPQNCGGSGGCEGATAEIGYQYLLGTSGLSSEWKYPYESWYGQDFDCRSGPKVGSIAKLSSYVALPTNDYDALLNAVAFVGPISVSVDASDWSRYESGIFDACNMKNPDIDHAVQLVGYGVDKGVNYWIVRNSWTPSWGEKGFIRVRRDAIPECGLDITPLDGNGCPGGPQNITVCGMCGILSDSSYPVVQV